MFSQPFQGVVRHLVILNVLAYFASHILLGEPHSESLGRYMLAAWPPESGQFQPYQLLSSLFMHFDIAHLAFNMFSLYMFGTMVEMIWGPKRFLLYYLLCGVGALALHFYMGHLLQDAPGPVMGASGAIYGILIAFAYLFPDVQLQLLFPPIPIKAKYLALILIAVDVLGGFGGYQSKTAHFAHLGGALTGFLLILGWYRGRLRP
ncbi:MAG TPA: rhomboid family intramembrane serine protease [Saprospiraceae bacterium]|nr:rhomboid family intramembrane serine protease [Saprospiraceae bacterium]HND88359.1 rhomboid family intramembrane serine protease [Saprospiraceae bacterium]HNG89964.1 rhomboid family intramembrane serine protease [Saprospiraceae bacterium]